jgi:hypothetical protein
MNLRSLITNNFKNLIFNFRKKELIKDPVIVSEYNRLTKSKESELFSIIESNDLERLKSYLSTNPVDEVSPLTGNNSVHYICLKARTPEFLNQGIALLHEYNHNMALLNLKKYFPLQTLIINNDAYYIYDSFLDIVPHLIITYFSASQIPRGCAHPYFLLYDYPFQTAEDLKKKQHLFLDEQFIGVYKGSPKESWKNLNYPTESVYLFFKDCMQAASMEEFTYLLTNRKSKSIMKLVHDEVINGDFKNMYLIHFLSIHIPDDQVVIKFYHLINSSVYVREHFESELCFSEMKLGVKNELFESVYLKIEPTRFEKYFAQQNIYELKDTLYMTKYLLLLDIKIPFKDLKTCKELHDWTSKEVTKIKHKPFDLNQVELFRLDGLNLDKYTLHVPKTNIDLINAGRELSICIGSTYYAEKALMKETCLLLLKENEELVGAIEFKDGALIQAKFSNNRDMPNDLKKLISFQIKDLGQ